MTATTRMALAVDRGTAWTKGSIIGRVADRWRVAAHAAQPTEWGDDQLVDALVRRLAPSADHELTDALRGLVADAARIECHSPASPPRLALVSGSAEAGEAARRAAEAAGWFMAATVSLDDATGFGERLEALGAADADAWLLASGAEGLRRERSLEMAALVTGGRSGGWRPLVWSGPPRAAQQIAAVLGPDPFSATVSTEPRDAGGHGSAALRDVLQELWARLLAPDGSARLFPVAHRRAVAELSRRRGLAIVAVDVGSTYASWVSARDGTTEMRVRAGGGLSSPSLTGGHLPSRLAQTLPRAVDEVSVADALQAMRIWPTSVPETQDDLAVVQAAARYQLAGISGGSEPPAGVDLLIGSGRAVAAAPRPGDAAAILIDSVRPLGVTQLAIDQAGLLAPLGSLPDDELAEGVEAMHDDGLVPLGAAVVSRGGRPGHLAMRARVHREGGVSEERAVRYGTLETVALAPGAEAELDINLERGVSLGEPRAGRRVRAHVVGGPVGIVLDARDIPLVVSRRLEQRRGAAWSRDVTTARDGQGLELAGRTS